jgi:hypothetical protein
MPGFQMKTDTANNSVKNDSVRSRFLVVIMRKAGKRLFSLWFVVQMRNYKRCIDRATQEGALRKFGFLDL